MVLNAPFLLRNHSMICSNSWYITTIIRRSELIFNRTYKGLCSLSARMVKSHELAEEIVDDVFCSFWTNRKKF